MTKDEYIHQLLEKTSPEIRVDIDTKEWWWVPVEDQWRLTLTGRDDFAHLEAKSWEFDFASGKLQPWMFLKLSRHLKTPYYIVNHNKHSRLVLFDSRSAVMINLFGSLDLWLRRL